MPTDIPPKRPDTPKWRPDKDPNPISKLEEETANGVFSAVVGCAIFVFATLSTEPELLVEHADFFRGISLAFMTCSAWILWRVRP